MSKTEAKTLRTELLEEGRVLRVVLDAGKGNVVDSRLVRELRESVAAAHARPLCALLLDHTGEHFSYGASVEEHAPGAVEELLPAFHALAREVLHLDAPLLSCVRGLCLGGGLELAALGDRIFAAPGARFGQPEIALGVFAPIGSALLPRRLAPADAADLLLSGRTIEAEEALRIGLVAELAADPGERALAWAREYLVPHSASSMRFAVQALRRSWREGFLTDLSALEKLYLQELMTTRDAREGIASFLEKRRARWEDR